MKTAFRRKLRADEMWGMLASLQFRIFCLAAKLSETVTQKQFYLLLCMGRNLVSHVKERAQVEDI
jgi:hypothetical protein